MSADILPFRRPAYFGKGDIVVLPDGREGFIDKLDRHTVIHHGGEVTVKELAHVMADGVRVAIRPDRLRHPFASRSETP